jgi:Ni/Co efflux regulator RcnB
MKTRVLARLVQAVVCAALVASGAAHAATAPTYDGYKSGYPRLHRILTYHTAATRHTDAATAPTYDGYKSGYPQLHRILTYHTAATRHTAAPDRGFAWRDAGIGLLVGVLGAGLILVSLSQLRRNRTTVLP